MKLILGVAATVVIGLFLVSSINHTLGTVLGPSEKFKLIAADFVIYGCGLLALGWLIYDASFSPAKPIEPATFTLESASPVSTMVVFDVAEVIKAYQNAPKNPDVQPLLDATIAACDRLGRREGSGPVDPADPTATTTTDTITAPLLQPVNADAEDTGEFIPGA